MAAGFAALGAGLLTSTDPGADAVTPRPNVVVVMSDDQTADSMRFMPRIRSQIGGRGATFTDSFTDWPLCCPSRATYLTGQYAINHEVRGNGDAPPENPVGGYADYKPLHGTSNLATWMHDAGYLTAHVGKYLNGYALGTDPDEVPMGWDEWYTSASRAQVFYDYSLNENGTIVPYGHQAADYKGDVVTGKALDVIARRAPAAQPFFLSVAYTAPHDGGPDPNPQPPSDCGGTAKPAPRHATAFNSTPLPQPPSYNESDPADDDKPQRIQSLPTISQGQRDLILVRYRCRAESLLHVDEGVYKMLVKLFQLGELNNTYVIYTADNGFHHGEHKIPSGKNRPYEEAIRVPLLMSGPGIPKNVKVRDLAINADLAPTILDAADAQASGHPLDGRSLLPATAASKLESGRELLIERGTLTAEGETDDPAGFIGIRNRNFKYVEYVGGERELYDLRRDPFELQSLHNDPAYDQVEAALAARLDQLDSCAGETCLSRPDLTLTLDHATGAGGCATNPVVARIGGGDGPNLDKVSYAVNGVLVATRTDPPFDATMPYARLRERAVSRVTATTETIDGRVLSLEQTVRAC